jgi:hypothetical protein
MAKSPDPDNFDGMSREEIIAELMERREDKATLDPHAQFVEKYRRRGQARIDDASGKLTLWNSIFHPFQFEKDAAELMDAHADYADTVDRSIRQNTEDAVKARAERLAAAKYRK